jgi:chromosome segregation ATPase
MLMKQDKFNFLKEEQSVDNIGMLEEKITKVIEKIKVLTDENRSLNEKFNNIQGKLSEKDLQIEALKKELKDSEKLRENIDQLKTEREAIKAQVEDLIRDLEAVEL